MSEQKNSEGTSSPYKGHCYCGEVCFEIDEDTVPSVSLYCHCDSCRRAHAAAMLWTVIIPRDKFRITKGQSLVKEFKKAVDEEGKPTRSFCTNCGTRVCNLVPMGLGFFPSLLEEDIQRHLPEKFKPVCHWCSKEAIVDLTKLNDEVKHM
jgi:hypothetical protein